MAGNQNVERAVKIGRDRLMQRTAAPHMIDRLDLRHVNVGFIAILGDKLFLRRMINDRDVPSGGARRAREDARPELKNLAGLVNAEQE